MKVEYVSTKAIDLEAHDPYKERYDGDHQVEHCGTTRYISFQ